ncbi:MAG: LEA type 2 family protein [Balneolales bacterium]|nr:LEA type 2 family protein [Balneolales bacterium]
MQQPGVSIADFKFDRISLESIHLLFDVEVDNPNALAVSTKSYAFAFGIAGSNFLSASQPLTTEINASQTSTIEVPVSLGFNELFETFNTLRNQDETAFDFEGVVEIEVPVLGLVEVPVSYEGILPVVKLPQVSLGKLSVKSLSFTAASLEVDVNINNPNSFGIDLNSFNYTMNINGLSSLTGVITEQVSIQAKEENTVTIPLEVNLLQLGIGAYQKILNKEPFTYDFTGETNVGADLPFFSSSSFSFDKSGTVNILD